MNPNDYAAEDATGLAALIRAGHVSPGEVLDAALESIEAANPRINAVVALTESSARSAIAAGLPAGPFSGVPFLVKDLGVDVAGTVTTNGCRLFADAEPAPADSELVARYRRAGLVMVGRTNTPEFGLAPTTEPALFGPARNPHDLGRSPGGSSGGAAAAVASGMVPAAHASDGGGSIRIPASCCGLFGMKPTRGRVTLAPDRGEGWAGMSTQHAVSRTVRDSAALLDVVSDPAPGDPYWAPPPGGTFLAAAGLDPRSLRVGLCVTAANGAPVDPRCREAAEATALRLEGLGHRVQEVRWPFDPELVAAAQAGVVGANVAAAVQARLAELGRPRRDDDLEPVTAAIVDWGAQTGAVDYVNALSSIHRVGRLMGALFETIDVMVTPTMACLPPELGTIGGSDVMRFAETVAPLVAFTSVINMSGQPAMSLPLDRSDGDLPVGTQVVGRFGEETSLFRLAGQMERAHPWI